MYQLMSVNTYMIKKRRHCDSIHGSFGRIVLDKCQTSDVPELENRQRLEIKRNSKKKKKTKWIWTYAAENPK